MEKVNTAKVFKPDDITIELGDTTYRIIFDLNAFCELEKRYGSIDDILKLILGSESKQEVTVRVPAGDSDFTTYENFDSANIIIGDTPLKVLLPKLLEQKTATLSDTLELLYAGLMHDLAIYNQHDEITGYSVSKARIGSYVTLQTVREVNGKIALALLRDLVPARETNDSKNAEAPEPTAE